MGLFTKLRFWHVRSRWDYLAFPGLVQWFGVFPTVIGYGLLAVGVEDTGLLIAGLGVLLIMGMNLLSWTAALAAYYGPESHPHLERDGLYALAGLFFGPLVGPHYLWRTGQAD